MRDLSLTQEYFLCAMNDKGLPPALKSLEVSTCLLAGALLELEDAGCLARDEREKLTVADGLPAELSYLEPVFRDIEQARKPRPIKDLAEVYALGGKRFNKLYDGIGASLVETGCADIMEQRGLLRRKQRYLPRRDCVSRVIEKIRAEFLEAGPLSVETVRLAALLEKSGRIGDYFSKVETAALKKRLAQVRQSPEYADLKGMLEAVDMLLIIIAVSGASA